MMVAEEGKKGQGGVNQYMVDSSRKINYVQHSITSIYFYPANAKPLYRFKKKANNLKKKTKIENKQWTIRLHSN